MSDHIYTYSDPPSERDIEKAIAILEQGGVIACPIDDNWAFCCDASSHKALDRIRLLKPHHPKEQPFSLLVSSIAMASDMGVIDHQAYRTLKKAWPGPYTVLFRRARSLARQIKDKRLIVGLRVPKCPMMLRLIEVYGKPLATTSIPSLKELPELTMGYEVAEKYGHAIDLLLDLGEGLPCLESTIIDMSGDEGAELVRAGVGDPALFGL
jgi:tRNA threonylcarbamoyl adenosine modification protein (Sua5/YciO/YrdC/YwlC family)